MLTDLQRHGLLELLQTVYDALSEGGGKPSPENIERINELIAQYGLPYQHYRESINTAFAHWYRENPHKSRLAGLPPFGLTFPESDGRPDVPIHSPQQQGELRDVVWQILERTHGDPADEDALAVDSYCRQLGLSLEDARRVVGGITMQWHQQRGQR